MVLFSGVRSGRIVLGFCLLLLTACGDSSPIPIGLSVGWSGPAADMGREVRDGVSLAIEMVNAEGGIHGRPLELLVRDDGNTPESARQADRELIDAGAVVIIGHITSSQSLAAVDQANESKVLMLSPTTSTNKLSGQDDYFLRINESISNQSVAMAKHAFEKLGARNVAIVYDFSNRAFTEDYGNHFKKQFADLGGRISSELSYESSTDPAFLRLENELQKQPHDLVLILAPALDAARLSQQIRKLGDDALLMTSVWSTSSDLITTGGQSVEGLVSSSAFNRNSTNPEYVAFKQAFEKRFNYEANFAGVMSYEATSIIIDSMRNLGKGALNDERLSTLLRNEILRQSEFQGVQGLIVFDQYGDVQRKICIVEVRNGSFVALEE